MIRLVSRGRFTHDFVKAIIGAPEDREPVVRKLIQDAGGKVISYYGNFAMLPAICRASSS